MAEKNHSTPEKYSSIALADIIDPDHLFLPREECLAGNDSEEQDKANEYPYPGEHNKNSNVQPSLIKKTAWYKRGDRLKADDGNKELDVITNDAFPVKNK